MRLAVFAGSDAGNLLEAADEGVQIVVTDGFGNHLQRHYGVFQQRAGLANAQIGNVTGQGIAGLLLGLFWLVPYISQLFETIKSLFSL